MMSIVDRVRALRVSMLWLTVPLTVMWAGVSGSGGVLMVIAHALLVLLYFTTFDSRVMSMGLEPRLALTRGRSVQSVGVSRVVSAGVGVGVALVSLLLFFQSAWIATLSAASGVLIVSLVGNSRRSSLAWRMRWAEFLWAAVAVLGPLVLIRAYALSLAEGELETELEAGQIVVMSAGVLWMSILGAVGVGVYVLLCVIRDAAIDSGDGIATSATGLGPTWARVSATVWLVFGIAVAAFISSNQVLGGRSWGVAALFGATALVTQGMVWAREADRAVIVWWFGAGLVGVLGAVALA